MPSWKDELAKAQEQYNADSPVASDPLPVDLNSENTAMENVLGQDAFSDLPDDDVPLPAKPTVPMNPKAKPAMKTRNDLIKKAEKNKAAKMKEEQPVIKEEELKEDAEEEEGDIFDPFKYLETLSGAPSKQQVEQWKSVYGDVQFVPLEDGSAFIYRCLNYPDWKQNILMNEALVKNEGLLKEHVMSTCVLWPRMTPEKVAVLKGGLPDLMFNMVMESSYFIPVERAMAITVRL